MKKDFILKTKKDNILRISTYLNDDIKNPCLVYVHGFKGFKDWGFVPYLGEYFSNNGFFVITFNFSHNGVGKSLTEFDELDNFAKNTISLEVEELNEIIDSYSSGFFGERKNQKIGIIGHSRGGAITLLTGSQRHDVHAVAVWASISKIDRYSDDQKVNWIKKGFTDVLNNRTNQMMKLGIELLNDIELNKQSTLNIENAVKNMNKPLFISHGNQDTSVSISESKEIYNWANKDITTFLEIPETSHTFNIAHPFAGSNSKFDFLLEETNLFFQKHLR